MTKFYSLMSAVTVLTNMQNNKVNAGGLFPPDSLPEGFSYDITIDNTGDSPRLKFVAEVPENNYLGFSYGNGMISTDIVRFAAKKDEPYIEDMWTTLF